MITGIFHRRGGRVDPRVLDGMSAPLAHRASRTTAWIHGSIGLVHEGSAGSPSAKDAGQSFLDGSGRYGIACAGNVFNVGDVETELRNCGSPLGPVPSTPEVMLQTFLSWGLDGLTRLNGAFACAIFDIEKRLVVLARDQMGVEPLCYYVSDDILLFASEVKGILAHPGVSKAPDEGKIAEYLTCNRYLLASESSFFRGIARLLPGTALVVTPESVETKTYWSIDPHRRCDVTSFEEAVERVRDLIVDAVRIRIPKDGRVGAASSGGFDSSSVVGIASHVLRERGSSAELHTFSFDFGSDAADEPHLIDAVARFNGATHHHMPVLTPTFLSETDELIRANDGPTLEDSVLLLWKKKRRAREEGVSVLLSGLGGDELFMGRLNYMADLFHRLRWKDLYEEIRSIYPVNPHTGLRTPVARTLKVYALAPLQPYWMKNARRAHIANPFPPPWLSPSLARKTGVDRALPKPSRPRFDTVFDQDCFDVFYFELLGGAVPYHDVASSRWAVDTRFPFLDVRLVELMFTMPREWKIRRGNVRVLQKRAVEQFLPQEIMEQHVKKDFHPVLNAFLRGAYARELRPLLDAKNRRSSEYVNWDAVAKFHDDFLAGRIGNPHPLWAVTNLERWLTREFA